MWTLKKPVSKKQRIGGVTKFRVVALERMVEDGEGEGSLTNGNTTKPYCLSTYRAPQSEPRSEKRLDGEVGQVQGRCWDLAS